MAAFQHEFINIHQLNPGLLHEHIVIIKWYKSYIPNTVSLTRFTPCQNDLPYTLEATINNKYTNRQQLYFWQNWLYKLSIQIRITCSYVCVCVSVCSVHFFQCIYGDIYGSVYHMPCTNLFTLQARYRTSVLCYIEFFPISNWDLSQMIILCSNHSGNNDSVDAFKIFHIILFMLVDFLRITSKW